MKSPATRRRLAATAMALVALLACTGEALAAAVKPGRIERVRYEADGSTTRVISCCRVRCVRDPPRRREARKSQRRLVLECQAPPRR